MMILVLVACVLFSVGDALYLNKRISNGLAVDIGKYPSVVAIRQRETQEFLCVGTIIDAEWVLTSAKCVVYYPFWELEIMAGTISKTRPSSYSQIREVATYIFHDDYSMNGDRPNNIAVMKLSSPLDLTGDFVKAAALTDEYHNNWHWTKCTMTGWGGNEKTCEDHHENCEMWEGWGECDNNPPYMRAYCRKACGLCSTSDTEVPDYLRDSNVTVIPRQDCSKGRPKNIKITDLNKKNVCGFNRGYTTAACDDGDQGGPLFCLNDANEPIQIGVMSWAGSEDCSGGFPTVYMAVFKYMDWIREKTGLSL